MDTPIKLRWLGVAGIELSVNGQTLLIDPFITRFSFWRMWLGRLRPDRELIAERIPRGDFVLVTHAHWDHLMDVPVVARNTGAVALGSPHTCQLLAASSVAAEQIQEIGAGDTVSLSNFEVEVLPAEHLTLFGRPIQDGPLPPDLQRMSFYPPPLRARDYQMDRCFSFLIHTAGLRLLDWCSARSEPAIPADVLFVQPFHSRSYYDALLCAVQPKLVVPVHWDDLFRSLHKPVRPMVKPPRMFLYPRWAWPPLQRVNLTRFKGMVEQIAPQTRVLIPERFHVYDVRQLT